MGKHRASVGRALVVVAALLLLPGAARAQDPEGLSLEGASRLAVRPTPQGLAVEETDIRHGVAVLRALSGNREPFVAAWREEVGRRFSTVDHREAAHTVFRLWRLDDKSGRPAPKPLYTIDVQCSGGQMVDGAFYVTQCGADAEIRWSSVYRLPDGAWMADIDAPLAAFTLDPGGTEPMQGRWAALTLLLDHNDRRPPAGSVMLLTLLSADAVLDRVLVANDNEDIARFLRSKWDHAHRVGWMRNGQTTPFWPGTPVSRDEIAALRLAVAFFGARGETMTVPVDGDRFQIDRAELPAGFRLSRVKPVGELGEPFAKLRRTCIDAAGRPCWR